MARRSTLATQTEAKHALKAVMAAGVALDQIARLEFKPDGGVVVHLGRPEDLEVGPPLNYWDKKVFKK